MNAFTLNPQTNKLEQIGGSVRNYGISFPDWASAQSLPVSFLPINCVAGGNTGDVFTAPFNCQVFINAVGQQMNAANIAAARVNINTINVAVYDSFEQNKYKDMGSYALRVGDQISVSIDVVADQTLDWAGSILIYIPLI